MELKQGTENYRIGSVFGFNRTFMELKQGCA